MFTWYVAPALVWWVIPVTAALITQSRVAVTRLVVLAHATVSTIVKEGIEKRANCAFIRWWDRSWDCQMNKNASTDVECELNNKPICQAGLRNECFPKRWPGSHHSPQTGILVYAWNFHRAHTQLYMWHGHMNFICQAVATVILSLTAVRLSLTTVILTHRLDSSTRDQQRDEAALRWQQHVSS